MEKKKFKFGYSSWIYLFALVFGVLAPFLYDTYHGTTSGCIGAIIDAIDYKIPEFYGVVAAGLLVLPVVGMILNITGSLKNENLFVGIAMVVTAMAAETMDLERSHFISLHSGWVYMVASLMLVGCSVLKTEWRRMVLLCGLSACAFLMWYEMPFAHWGGGLLSGAKLVDVMDRSGESALWVTLFSLCPILSFVTGLLTKGRRTGVLIMAILLWIPWVAYLLSGVNGLEMSYGAFWYFITAVFVTVMATPLSEPATYCTVDKNASPKNESSIDSPVDEAVVADDSPVHRKLGNMTLMSGQSYQMIAYCALMVVSSAIACTQENFILNIAICTIVPVVLLCMFFKKNTFIVNIGLIVSACSYVFEYLLYVRQTGLAEQQDFEALNNMPFWWTVGVCVTSASLVAIGYGLSGINRQSRIAFYCIPAIMLCRYYVTTVYASDAVDLGSYMSTVQTINIISAVALLLCGIICSWFIYRQVNTDGHGKCQDDEIF